MTHLSAAELKAWYEQGRADDRGRVITHLAECDDCRRALSAFALAATPEVSAPAITAAEASPLGHAAYKPAPSAGEGWLSWLRPVYGLAATAVVLVVSALWLATPRPDDGGDVVRSSELVALSPAGSTSTLEFKWESPFAAAKYRVVIRDAGGALAFSAETTESRLELDAALRDRLATMSEYSWTVSALDSAGGVFAESKPRAFRYQP